MPDLVTELTASGALRTPRLIAAFRTVPRTAFLPPALVDEAERNAPLPIGHGQTISQPLTVALMLELVQPKPGERVLDVGAGSGWAAALLASVVGSTGRVVAVERVPALCDFARRNLAPFGFPQLELRCADGTRGAPDAAPFDVIHVAAAAPRRPPSALREQLTVGGRLVIPVGSGEQDLLIVTRRAAGRYDERRLPGFRFVPLIPGPYGETPSHP